MAVSQGTDDRASLRTGVLQRPGRAVTRGTRNGIASVFSHLRGIVQIKTPCRGNAAFDGRNFKRDDCALSRAQRRVDSAPWQAFVPAPTRWGLTTPHRGRRTAPLFPLSTEEKHRCSNELSSDGAVWTSLPACPRPGSCNPFCFLSGFDEPTQVLSPRDTAVRYGAQAGPQHLPTFRDVIEAIF